LNQQHELTGLSLLAGHSATHRGKAFRAYAPATGQPLDPFYYSASEPELNEAVDHAAAAAPYLASASGADRGRLLRAMADAIDSVSAALVERAHLETALPEPRLKGEVARTSNQLRLFAGVAEEGSWVMARIDTADPQRTRQQLSHRLLCCRRRHRLRPRCGQSRRRQSAPGTSQHQ
jgi:NADP-dependent aldehyde dehydrogenase